MKFNISSLSRFPGCWLLLLLFVIPKVQAQTIKVVNVIPASLSGETNQDSEPFLAVQTANPNVMVISAFTPNPVSITGNAPVYVSQDGGNSWVLNFITPVRRMTCDITHAMATGENHPRGDLHAGTLACASFITLDESESNDVSSANTMSVQATRNNVDQPFVRALAFGPQNFSSVYAQGDPGTGIGGYDLKSPADRAFAFDYDSSGKLDHIVLYRPGTGTMWILKNNAGTFTPVYHQGDPGNGIGGYDLKSPADRAFAFDYDSSGKLDHIVLYRPGTGTMWILKNSGGNFSPVYHQGDPGNGIGGYDLKSPADRAFAFDYDGSGKLDHIALYRPGTGTMWILKNSGGNFTPVYQQGDPGNGIGGYDLKSPADRAFAYDYDSSGKQDHMALYRPGTGTMWILKNSGGNFSPVYHQGDPGNGIGGYDLKSSADLAMAFDYDGSGKQDHIALYRPGTGTMWILKNSGGNFSPVYNQGDPGNGIGGYDLRSAADLAFAYDYEGSGQTDYMTLYRPGTGTMWILKKSNDHVYVGINDFNQPSGHTATVDVSVDGFMHYRSVSVEARSTSGQDGPSVRPAIAGDNTVYAAFFGWRNFSGATATSDVVVVRDDDGGTSASPFQALKDSSDHLAGQRVVSSVSIPWSNAPTLGQERIGSTLSIAVDPNNSSNVYVGWADRVGNGDIYTLHVRRSTDRGQTWSTADLPNTTVTNATNIALAVAGNGTVGMLYQQLTNATVSTGRWMTHLMQSNNGFTTVQDTVLATVPGNAPAGQFLPYLGDYDYLFAVGNEFRGVFCANNTPDQSNFPNGVAFQRAANFATKTLSDGSGNPVAISIDPFYFSVPII